MLKSLSRNAKKLFLFSILILPFFYVPAHAQPKPTGDDPIQLVIPQEGCFDFTKQVMIECTIKKPFDPEKLAVLLDGEDLDGIDVRPDGFEYTGGDSLTPGKHVLSVVVSTLDGKELEKEFGFSVCPFRISGETNSSQEPKSFSFATAPDSKGEGNPVKEAKPAKNELESTLKMNSRLYNQNLPAALAGNRFNVTASPAPNPNTLGTFSLTDNVRLKALYMPADQWSMVPDTSTLAGNLSVLSFGMPSVGLIRRGDMLGGALTSDLWGKKLVAEAEVNFSGFNTDPLGPYPRSPAPDVFSSFPSGLNSAFNSSLFRREDTYRLKLKGEWGNYNYEALYEYMDFEDPASGSQGINDTMQRYMLRVGGKFFQFNSLNLSVSQYMDKIKGNSLYPRFTITQAEIDYSFTKFENLPITLGYQRSMAATKDEPSGSPGTRFNMDTVTASINYLKGPWNLGFLVDYSIQRDLTTAKNDTNTLTLTFLPVYTWNRLSIAPGFSLGRSESQGVNTNTYTLSLDLRGELFNPKLTYGLGVAYTRLTTSDNSAKQDILTANANLFYSLPGKHWGFLNPSMGIMGLFGTTNDRILRQTRNDFEFFLMFRAKF